MEPQIFGTPGLTTTAYPERPSQLTAAMPRRADSGDQSRPTELRSVSELRGHMNCAPLARSEQASYQGTEYRMSRIGIVVVGLSLGLSNAASSQPNQCVIPNRVVDQRRNLSLTEAQEWRVPALDSLWVALPNAMPARERRLFLESAGQGSLEALRLRRDEAIGRCVLASVRLGGMGFDWVEGTDGIHPYRVEVDSADAELLDAIADCRHWALISGRLTNMRYQYNGRTTPGMLRGTQAPRVPARPFSDEMVVDLAEGRFVGAKIGTFPWWSRAAVAKFIHENPTACRAG